MKVAWLSSQMLCAFSCQGLIDLFFEVFELRVQGLVVRSLGLKMGHGTSTGSPQKSGLKDRR